MKTKFSKCFAQFVGAATITLLCLSPGWAGVELEDRPTNMTPPPANLLFTPSVEFPTMVEVAHNDIVYNSGKEYLGYFDPKKCYTYNHGQGYFEPVSFAGMNHSCPSSSWSGNALNYATMGGMDTFRWALTGGARVIDTPTTKTSPGVTVLRRSYQSLSSVGKLKNRSIPTPHGWVSPDSDGQGVTMKIGNSVYNVHVRVCDAGKGVSYLEDNCVAYKVPTTGLVTYKPIGLIQRYQDKIRFGVFSYLLNRAENGGNINNPSIAPAEINGAVLRARLKNVGPLTWDEKINENVEWDATTGVFIKNPDTDDARNSRGGSVSKSGVINYLNDFGFDSKNYQELDQPSEMFAEALRYLMKLSPTSLYYTPTTLKTGEGFPVIVDWWKNNHDSVLSSCQKNAIVGIGDVNTHKEQNVGAGAGSLLQEASSGMKAINDKEKSSVAQQCWGRDANPTTCTDGGSNKIAGLAYYAHNNNLRSDLTGKTGKKITVDTYWVDVLETGYGRQEIDGEYVHRNQYWLATKYGGMDNHGAWNKKNRTYKSNSGKIYPVPDNYFPASDPKAMVDGLRDIFAEVGVEETFGTGAGAGWSSSRKDDNVTHYYRTRYSAVDWSGALEAYDFGKFNSDGSVTSEKLWDAATKIDRQNWESGRRMVTYAKQADGTYKGVPFRFNNLTEIQKKSLGSGEHAQKDALSYLRGDKSNENLPEYRSRKTLLGDIVHSKPVEVGKPSAGYGDDENPGYSAYSESQKDRTKVVYVGANDGMLHAIKGVNGDSNDGTELWTYVPSFLFEGPDNPRLPDVSGLRALTQATYSHRYYIDAELAVQDVDFRHTKKLGGNLPASNDSSADWRTVLVSGLGKGGKGFFALDVTDPLAASEADAASKILWEFPRLEDTDPDLLTDISDMGFSFGRPLITKTKAWGWVVILTSGYNNNSGKGVLYVLNVKTGEKLARVETGVGTKSQEAGFVQISGFTPLYADYTTDQIYGGDLQGNLWRFDLTGSSIPPPDNIAKLTDGDGKSQPITAAPIIEVIEDVASPVSGSRWVIVGTGQWLSPFDIAGEKGPGLQTQTMYAIRDGDFNATEITNTVHRTDLGKITSFENGLKNAPERGWYYDLEGSLGKSKERIIHPAAFVPHALVWTGIIPQGAQDECRVEVPDGNSRFYAVDLATGKTKLSYKAEDSGYYEKDGLTVGFDIVKWNNTYYVGGMTSKGEAFTLLQPIAVPGAGLSKSGVINWRTIRQRGFK
ncbi:MAG: hypothetical protein LBE32_06525 [Burkholderiales bacterium]|nr:hypothetical protein [Burkholderiales bacterium]